MGFHGQAGAHKPKITMHNTKRQLKWCKACRYWTLEQWKCILWSDKWRFTIWQSDRRIWVSKQTLFVTCAEYNMSRYYCEMLTYKPLTNSAVQERE